MHWERRYLRLLQPECSRSPGFGNSSRWIMLSHRQPSHHQQLLSWVLFYPMSHSPEFFSELVPFNPFLRLHRRALQLSERLRKSVTRFSPRTQALLRHSQEQACPESTLPCCLDFDHSRVQPCAVQPLLSHSPPSRGQTDTTTLTRSLKYREPGLHKGKERLRTH